MNKNELNEIKARAKLHLISSNMRTTGGLSDFKRRTSVNTIGIMNFTSNSKLNKRISGANPLIPVNPKERRGTVAFGTSDSLNFFKNTIKQ